MNEQEKGKSIIDHIPSQTLDLMLDLVLEVMQAERGSIMLLDELGQELTISSARGLESEIIDKTRVPLGSGISGTVVASGKSVFLNRDGNEQPPNIKAEDMINPDIDNSYIAPIKLHDGTRGTININSIHMTPEIRTDKEQLVKRILYRFSEYLALVAPPLGFREEPSQLYMMNIFREYSTLQKMRVFFDYIFHLITDLIQVPKKGVLFLKSPESDLFDLVLGYGIDTKWYRDIYEELIPQLKKVEVEPIHDITVFKKEELFSSPAPFFKEAYYILMPMVWENIKNGQILLFAEESPVLDGMTKTLTQSICKSAARIIEESASGQTIPELRHTDNLTGTYNYGLWWKRLMEEISRARRQGDSRISLIVLDIDQFDRFNHTYGFLVGDQLLRLIADRIQNCLRIVDMVGRIGGDEFGIALPDTPKQDALRVADRILNAVLTLPAEIRIKEPHSFTMSGGIAEFPDDADTPGKLVEKAKTALVSAKIMGGNRIKSFTHLEE